MTREEIEACIRDGIDGYVTDMRQDDNVIEEYVKTIADHWEEDVQENRDAAYQEGIHIGQESV